MFCVFQGSQSLFLEILKSLIGASKYSFSLLMFYVLQVTNVFIPKWKYKYYYDQNEALKKKFTVRRYFHGVLSYLSFMTMVCFNFSLDSRIFLVTTAYSYTQHILLLPITIMKCSQKLLESCMRWYLMYWDYHQHMFLLDSIRKACL